MEAITSSSPPITHLKWGQIEVEGRRYKDAKLFPGGVKRVELARNGDAAPTGHSTSRRDRIARERSQSGGSDPGDVEDAAS